VTDYSWFRLLLRATGVLLIGLSLPTLLSQMIQVVAMWWAPAAAPYTTPWAYAVRYTIPYVAGYLAQAAFGFYLLFGAERLIARCLRGVRGHCSNCGYDITAVTMDACPECGVEIPQS